MKIDPRFSLSVEDEGGQKALRFHAAVDAALVGIAVPLFDASFGELCDLAGVGTMELRSPSRRGRYRFSGREEGHGENRLRNRP